MTRFYHLLQKENNAFDLNYERLDKHCKNLYFCENYIYSIIVDIIIVINTTLKFKHLLKKINRVAHVFFLRTPLTIYDTFVERQAYSMKCKA